MIKIGFNITPLKIGHKDRGIGYYTKLLVANLNKQPNILVQEYSNLNELRDVDLVHYPWFDFYFRTLKILPRVPTVVTIHDVIPLLFSKNYPAGIKGRLNLFLQKQTLRKCKMVITDSECSKKDINRLLNVPQELIKVIPLAASSAFKVLSSKEKISIKERLNLPDKFLLYVGDANFIKNIPFLITGFYKIKSDPVFSDLKLVLVGKVFKEDHMGKNTELLSIVRTLDLIKECNLESEIIKIGQLTIEDLVGVYNIASAYIQPSLYEGFGLPVLEAFSCGCPVITSNGGSLPEVAGESAIYFDPEKIDDFIQKVRSVLLDSKIMTELSNKGLKRAKLFSWEKTAKETAEVYENVTKHQR